jgi:Zn-dependent protease with chaperone function
LFLLFKIVGIVKSHEYDEIIVILAHEAGHWKKKHVLRMLLLMQTILATGKPKR